MFKLLSSLKLRLSLGLLAALIVVMLAGAACDEEGRTGLSLLKELARLGPASEAGFRFDLTVRNETNEAIQDVTVKDSLPDGMGVDNVTAAVGAAETADGDVTWRLDSLDSLESVIISIFAFCSQMGDFTNEAEASASGFKSVKVTAAGNCDYAREGPTATPTGTATSTGTPSAQQVTVAQQPGCNHEPDPPRPGESDLIDLIFAFLAESEASSGPESLVFAGAPGPLLGEQPPLVGATITARAEGPGVIETQQSAVTDAEGAARLTFPINAFGDYTITIEEVTDAQGNPLELDPAGQNSVDFTVEADCSQPPGFY